MTHRSNIYLIAIILTTLLFSGSGYATNSLKDIKQLDSKIAQMQNSIAKAQNKRQVLLSALAQIETALGQCQQQLDQTNQALTQQQQQYQQVADQVKQSQQTLNQQQLVLAEQLRTAYRAGRQPYLKLLLNQQSAENLHRMLAYYRYINSAQTLIIKSIQHTLVQLKVSEDQLQKAFKTLTQLRAKQLAEKDQLTAVQRKRQQVVVQLNRSISTDRERLSQLITDKHHLESTLAKLNTQMPWEQLGRLPFAKQKGHLFWPAKGKVLHYFGTQIAKSELRWEGVLIKATQGQGVYAIANGKVVFAKWLPGYGLLIIISHGNGYMTLYGRNHQIYKQAGDIVRAGELIATVGNTGGYSEPSLYFAIRHNAKPLNPTAWCTTTRRNA